MNQLNDYHIIVVSGYAQSGKTKFIKKLVEKYDFHKISSSNALHKFAETLLFQIFNVNLSTYRLKDKQLNFNFSVNNIFKTLEPNRLLGRDFLIKLAEKVLKPIFGQDIFVRYQIREAHKKLSENKRIVIETIGGEEFDLLLKAVNNTWACYPNAVAFINLRSENELPDIDGRTLINGGYEIWDTEIDNL